MSKQTKKQLTGRDYCNIVMLLLIPLFLLSFSALGGGKKDKDEQNDPLNSGTFSALKFRSIGPAYASGRIADFAVNPNNHSEYYVGVAAGNVWKTTNSGITWTPIFDNYGSWSIADVEIDPNNTNVVWVGTGEYNSQRAIGYGDGIYKSMDGGKSFKNMGLKESEHIGRIIIDPRNSDVYVAAQGPLWGPGGDRGLYKSTDGGENWEKILEISENTGVTDIVMDPRDPDVLYAASYQRRRHVFTLINGGPESAIYKSEDAGKTWRELKSGLPSADMGRIGLAISPANPDIIYAIMDAAEGHDGIYRSTDRGESWTKRSDYVSTSGQYYNRLYCDPVDENKLYSMDTWSKVSVDGGKTWENIGNKHKHVDDHAMWIDPEDTSHFILGSDGGIYETFDDGKNWDFKENLPVTQFYRVAVDNRKPFYYVYGGTQDNNSMGGPSRTISSLGIVNDDWFVTNGGDGFQSRIDPEDPNIVYAQSQYGWLVRYDKKSGERISIKPQPPSGEAYRWNWNSPLIISPHSHTRLYFAANKVFRSDDRGNTWEVISPDLTRQINRNELPVMGMIQSPEAVAKNASTSLFGNIVEITESPLVENLIYVGTDDGLIRITENGGETWKKVEHFPGLPDTTYVSCLLASRYDENTVYACFDGRKKNDLKPYILKSTDRGETWESMVSNLPERGTVYKIVEDHKDEDLLFTGTEFGVYFTIDGGEKWIQLKGGLPVTQVRDIAIQEAEDDLVVATFGRSFYILDNYAPLRQMEKEDLDKEFVLYPVRDALMFIQKSGKYNQGETYYAADNPPVAAVFTYYLKETPKTLKQIRKEKEKEAREKGEPIDYPSFEELRKEDMEEKAYLMFVIKDDAGETVRKLKTSPSSGMNRMTWDMRYLSTNPETKEREKNTYDGRDGHHVMPGKYSVEVMMVKEDSIRPLGQPQQFEIIPLENTTLPAEDRAAMVAFQDRVAELNRVVRGTMEAAEETEEQVDIIIQTLRNAPEATHEMLQKARSIKAKLEEIDVAFHGDKSISKRNANQPPSISSRLGILVYGFWRSTSEPTQTMKDMYDIIQAEFDPQYEALKNIREVEMAELQEDMEQIKAPWTPGTMPLWRK